MKIKRILFVAVIASVALAGAAFQSVVKTKVCHVPFGSPMNTHTLEIPAHAVQGHLDHGDYLGDCKHNPNSNHE